MVRMQHMAVTVLPVLTLPAIWAAPVAAQDASEDFEAMPAWSSYFDAGWGGQAAWSILGGGQAGNCLEAWRNNGGSSVKAKVYSISASTDYTVSVYIRCPSSSGPYWAECAFKLGNNTAQDFDANGATWTMIQKFADTGPNGNGDIWTQYSANVNSGANTQITVAFKLGSSAGTAPAIKWDTLRITASGGGANLVANPSFEGGFTNGLANGWQSWSSAGTGYWKQSSLLGRIGPGVYGLNNNPYPAVIRYNPKVVLLFEGGWSLAASVRSALPDSIIIGRKWIDDRTATYLSNPEYYGAQFGDEIHTLAGQYPGINVWTGMCEPPVGDANTCRLVARFEKAFSDRLHYWNLKSCVLNLAVGNPGDMNNMLLTEVVNCLAGADYVGYHSYGSAADMLMCGPDAPWYAHRWRYYAAMYAQYGYRMPPVIYTECTTWSGWKGLLSAAQIRDDLMLFESQSRLDPWSVGMTIFICGDNGGWAGFETANEPTIYEGCGDYNAAHPADAYAGVYSQQFGETSGGFTGGIRQAVAVTAGHSYQLDHAAKLETYGVNTSVSYRVGYDLTGQTSNPAAGSIVWTGDLIAAEYREKDMWYANTLSFTATGSSVSIWFKGSQASGLHPWRLMVDDVSLVDIGGPAAPVITRSPATLTPSCAQGSNASNQTFTVQNTGDGTLSYSITDNVTWLSCSPTSGTGTGEADTITVTYATSGLAVGTYNATITISDPNATNNPQTIGVTLTVNKKTVAEDFNSVPSWTSTFDAPWGGAATWSAVSGGQSGNCLQATRSNTGSSAKVKVYNISPNASYTISVYMRCPSSSDSYWRECFYKMGSYTAQDFDNNGGTWTEIKKFSNTGTNGNGDTWVQYSKTFNSGSNTQISVGFKTGNSGGTSPTIKWDTLRIN